MKKLLVSIAVVLFLVCAADAAQPKISLDRVNTSQPFPNITMAEAANITLDGGLIKNLQSDGILNVLSYGAVGDGVTDDATHIKAALDAADEGDIVILPPGLTFGVGSAIDPADWEGKTLSGYGARLKLLDDITLLNISDNNVTLLGFTIVEDSANTKAAIELGGGATGVLGHNRLTQKDILIHDENIVADATASGNWIGYNITGHGHASYSTNIRILNPHIGIIFDPVTGDWVTDEFWHGLSIQAFDEAMRFGTDVGGNTFERLTLINTVSTPAVGINVSTACDNTFSGFIIWWDGSRLSTFDAIKSGATSKHNAFMAGHVEGSISDLGTNTFYSVSLNDIHDGSALQSNGIYSNVGTANLIQNGNFEVDTGHWTASGVTASLDTTIKKFGESSIKVTGRGGVVQVVNTSASRRGYVTFGSWIYAPSTNTNDTTFLYISNGVSDRISSVIAGDDLWHWVTVSLDLDGASSATVVLYSGNSLESTDTAYFDGVQLVDGPLCSSIFTPYVNPHQGEILSKSASYVIEDSDPDTIVVGAIGAHSTFTLPTATDNIGRVITIIIASDPGAYNVIIDGDGTETINGATTKTNSDVYSYLVVLCNGTGWNIIGSSGSWS